MSIKDKTKCEICNRPYNWCEKAEHYKCAECRKITCCDDMIECGGNFGQCKRSICRTCWQKRTYSYQTCTACNNYMGYSKSKHQLYHAG